LHWLRQRPYGVLAEQAGYYDITPSDMARELAHENVFGVTPMPRPKPEGKKADKR
jgi:hypothetical protein